MARRYRPKPARLTYKGRGTIPHTDIDKQIAGNFGRLILALREKRGLSKLRVADVLGLERKRLNQLESGQRVPRLSELVEMAALYHVDAVKLLREVCDFPP